MQTTVLEPETSRIHAWVYAIKGDAVDVGSEVTSITDTLQACIEEAWEANNEACIDDDGFGRLLFGHGCWRERQRC